MNELTGLAAQTPCGINHIVLNVRDMDVAHRFWTVDGPERVPQLNAFLEHLSIVAGFVLVAILSARGARRHG